MEVVAVGGRGGEGGVGAHLLKPTPAKKPTPTTNQKEPTQPEEQIPCAAKVVPLPVSLLPPPPPRLLLHGQKDATSPSPAHTPPTPANSPCSLTPVPFRPSSSWPLPQPPAPRTRHALAAPPLLFQARPGHSLGMAQKINSSSDLRNFMTRV